MLAVAFSSFLGGGKIFCERKVVMRKVLNLLEKVGGHDFV
jgi:hypothetical protein